VSMIRNKEKKSLWPYEFILLSCLMFIRKANSMELNHTSNWFQPSSM
jgi:hypothetical protein